MFKQTLFTILLVVPMCSYGFWGKKEEVKKEEHKSILSQFAHLDADIFKKRFARCEEKKKSDVLACYEKEQGDLKAYLAEAEPFSDMVFRTSYDSMQDLQGAAVVGIYCCSLKILEEDVQKRMEELRKQAAK